MVLWTKDVPGNFFCGGRAGYLLILEGREGVWADEVILQIASGIMGVGTLPWKPGNPTQGPSQAVSKPLTDVVTHVS